MLASVRRRVGTIITAVVALGVVLPGVAQAAPPSNDDFDGSTVVTALPFTTQLDIGEATRAIDDPSWCQGTSGSRTVWFSYTAAEDTLLRATTAGSDFETVLSANTGTHGDLSGVPEACDLGIYGGGATITFSAHAGTTYHFQVSDYYRPGASLSFGLQALSPAANDSFAAAEPIVALPDTRAIDLSVATTEYDEPTQQSPNCAGSVTRSVWYAFTATETRTLVAKVDKYDTSVSVYTGSTLPNLLEIGCNTAYGRVLFRATEGTTYYLRVGGSSATDAVALSLVEAPALQPHFSISPSDPTIYEMTNFSVNSGEFGTPVASGEWDFGDGTVAPAVEPGTAHHYTADGTYQVRLSIVSADGRTGTTTSTVTVDTHDVSIGKFATPTKARTGDTKQITVNVANTRYRESSVMVYLYKSDGSSWQEVGRLSLAVPAHPTRPVKFPFAYTFTAADAVVGKVAFRAVVALPYPTRDARPFDNELISAAATVQPSLADLRGA